jgi:hypothetical protein
MRVYINNFDAEHFWSVDDGDISTETQWDKVSIQCESYTELDLSKRGSKTEPCCWIECIGKLYDAGSMTKRIAVIR